MNRRTVLMGGAVATVVPATVVAAAEGDGGTVFQPRPDIFVFHSGRELTAKQHGEIEAKLRARLGPDPIIITTCGDCSLTKL